MSETPSTIFRVRHHASRELMAEYELARERGVWPFTDEPLPAMLKAGDVRTVMRAGHAVTLEVTALQTDTAGGFVSAEFLIRERLDDSAIAPGILGALG